MRLPSVFRNGEFGLYWSGVVLSQTGTRATLAANLYQVYVLTHSVLQTGFVGAAQAVALLSLSPVGGAYADRVNRRRLIQWTQGTSLMVAAGLAAITFTGQIRVWQVLVSVVLTTAAATFDQPARQALIPAMVPRAQLPQAFALLNPSRELAFLLGPALAGVLITMGGPGLAYAVDAATYALLVCVLAVLRIPGAVSQHAAPSVWAGIGEGLSFVRHRPLICLLMGLDLSATLFGAYRVVLPALALRVLHVCSTGYGLLSAAPSAGALLATYGVFRIVGRSRRLGRVLLVSTLLYGVSAVLLAQAPWFWVALTAALLLGAFDALPTSIRLAAIQLETPDRLRGRVSAFYQMPARGGPALGDVVIGAIAGAIGPVAALTVGGLVTVGYVSGFLARPNRVRDYTGSRSAGDAESRDQELRAAPA